MFLFSLWSGVSPPLQLQAGLLLLFTIKTAVVGYYYTSLSEKCLIALHVTYIMVATGSSRMA